MGGRGSSSGAVGGGGGGSFGGYPTLARLIGAMNEANANGQIQPQPSQNNSPPWDDNGNPAVVAYQNMPDNNVGHYLHQVDGKDMSQVKDKWDFYDNPSQKLVTDLGLNGKPTILSKSDFDNYVAKTGAEVMYRGWSGADSRKRFMQSDYSHIGCGRYGDGYYFGSQATASGYGSTKSTVALGPKTKMIDVNTLRAEMAKMSNTTQRSMRIAGHTGSRSYRNSGEMQAAIKLGYNCIDAGWCKVVIDRSILIVRDV